MTVNLNEIARVHRLWQDRNFGTTMVTGTLALAEEMGEVSRAVLKAHEGIRPETRGDLGTEICDVLLTALSLADRAGIDIESVFESRRAVVWSRDFTVDKEAGQGSDDKGMDDYARHMDEQETEAQERSAGDIDAFSRMERG